MRAVGLTSLDPQDGSGHNSMRAVGLPSLVPRTDGDVRPACAFDKTCNEDTLSLPLQSGMSYDTSRPKCLVIARGTSPLAINRAREAEDITSGSLRDTLISANQ